MPKFENPKKEQNNSEQYQREALEVAQRISRQWQKLKEAVQSDPQLLANDPQLWEINELTRPPKSGIQVWFEGQVKWIEEHAGNDENAKSRMIYRLKEDLERIEKQFNDVI